MMKIFYLSYFADGFQRISIVTENSEEQAEKLISHDCHDYDQGILIYCQKRLMMFVYHDYHFVHVGNTIVIISHICHRTWKLRWYFLFGSVYS